MKKTLIFVLVVVGILFVGLISHFSSSGVRIGDRFCVVNPKYSKDNPLIGTSLEINDIANGVVIYTMRQVVPDDVDGQKGTASIEKLNQTIMYLGVSKTECGKLDAEEKKQYEIDSAKIQKAKDDEAKKVREHDDFVKQIQPGTVICSFSDQPNSRGHYEYRIYKYQNNELGYFNFAGGKYNLEKNDIELVTKSDNPIGLSERELDTDFPKDLTFFGRDACLAEANKRFKQLATKITDAGLKVGDIGCSSSSDGLIYQITNIAVVDEHGVDSRVELAPEQFAEFSSVTLNRQTRQIASVENGAYKYTVYPATMNRFHYGKDNCLKEIDEYERQKKINSKF